MADFEVKITDNSQMILREFEHLTEAALEAVGLAATAHAVEGCPVGTTESTHIKNYHGGGLRKSLTHKVIGNDVYVGTNYSVTHDGRRIAVGPFVEYGTGIYAADGNGRKSPWVWIDKNGKGHYTHGMKPRHFLRNALSNPSHIREYKHILQAVYTGKNTKF